MPESYCANCEKPMVKKRNGPPGKFCSAVCRVRHWESIHGPARNYVSRAIGKVCRRCTKPLGWHRSKFCSYECQQLFKHPGGQGGKAVCLDACQECGAKLPLGHSARHRFCSTACRSKAGGRLPIRKARQKQREAERRNAKKTEPIDPRAVYERDAWRCHLCRRPVDPKRSWPDPLSSSLDHVLPISKGGEHVDGNVRLAHLGCNLSKGAKPRGQMVLI